MDEVTFLVEEQGDGGYIARALGACIFTEADNLAELYERVRDAACCHCEECARPKTIRLRFVRFLREEIIPV